MVCGRCWLVIKIQTFSFVCLTIPGLIMPFNWKSVSLCIFLLVSVILFYPEEQVFFHAKNYQNMPKNMKNIYFMQWTWNYQLSWSWSCPIQKIYVLSRTHKKQTNVGVAFIRITRFHYRNINHVYQWNYCLSYFGLYFGYQRLISTW